MQNVVNTFNVTFFIRKERASNGQCPIYAAVNLNRRRLKIATKLSIEEKQWDVANGYPKGKGAEAKQLRMKIDEIKNCYFNYYHQLLIAQKPFDVEDIKNLYLGVKEQEYTLMKLFEYHNETSKTTLAGSTLKHYHTTHRYFKDFIKFKYNKTDIYLSQLNLKFVTEFEFYMYDKNKEVGARQCQNNGIMKHVIRLRKVLNLAIRNEWLEKDPFLKYKISITPSNRLFLDADELLAIEEKSFEIKRLQQVKDIFVFSCYTGLAYIDAINLKPEKICKGINGKLWIRTARTKTDIPVNVPILPKAQEILNIYQDYRKLNRIFPPISNQKMNAYLKEVADICGITKPLTFHIARHTFATTVTLTNGVPIETVSKMLGHSNINTTQIYAKVVDTKISDDMDMLFKKFDKVNKKTIIS